MTEQYYNPELVRFAFVLGIVVSILFYERFQLTTGGIAAPGYLAFGLFDPLVLPGVFLTAFLSYFTVHQGLAKFILLPRAAQFSLLILMSAALHLALDFLLISFTEIGASSQLLRGIGYIIPGLVAHDFARHGVGRTITAVTITSAVVASALLVVLILMPQTAQLRTSPVAETVTLALAYLPVLIFVSLIAWLGLVRLHGLRCGGFLGGAYLTLLVLQPSELARFIVTAFATLLIVKYILPKVTILFGQRRFASHMLVGSCLNWTFIRISEVHLNGETLAVVTPSLAVLGVLLTGLLSNDMDTGGLKRTFLGVVLSVAFSLSGTLFLVESLTHQRPSVALPLLAILLIGGGLMSIPPERIRRFQSQITGQGGNAS
jgi:poly-gamma-glutamate biosynthesis protein PgsC/CapC